MLGVFHLMTPTSIDLKTLPSDAEKLKSMIVSQVLNQQNMSLNHQNEIISQKKTHTLEVLKYEDELKRLDHENKILREQVRLLKMKRFAASSEKLPSNQNELFNEAEFLLKEEAGSTLVDTTLLVSESKTPALEAKARGKRKALPENLPREEVIVDLADEEKICAKDHAPTALREIAPEVSEQLDYVPARLKVIRTTRKKYICPCCDETIKTAPLPEKILPKSNAAAGLLAYIATSKYVDALPLYRLSAMFKRMEVELPRNTMASWMIALSEQLLPVYNLMQDDLLSSDYVCCDETITQVLKEPGKKPEAKSYMWVRTRPGEEPIILFDYDPTRSGEVPKKLLEGFEGYLQVDGYAGYDGVITSLHLTRVGCMAHMRRKFFEAYQVSENPEGDAAYVLNQVKLLYKIEDEIEEKKPEEKKNLRQKESLPILNTLKKWLDDHERKYAPQTLMGKAITYARKQWETLLVYTSNGKLNIDNNFTENRIRPFAVGRKNWLFSDTVAGAEASARIYSILQTARANGLEPYAYFKHLLIELPKAKIAEEIEKLLPYKIEAKVLD